MLVLTRRVGETICIGDLITVTVMDAKTNSVQFGINAPEGTSVDREEARNPRNKYPPAPPDLDPDEPDGAA